MVDLIKDLMNFRNLAAIYDTFMKTFREYDAQARWSPTGLLEGLKDEAKSQCAIALEAQRIQNESGEQQPPQFLRASIPIIRRVFGIIPEAMATLEKVENWHSSGVWSGAYFIEKPSESKFSMQLEAEKTAELAAALASYVKKAIGEGKFAKIAGIKLDDNGNILVNAK